MKYILFILLLIPVTSYAQYGGDGAFGSVSGYLKHVNVTVLPAADNLYSLGDAAHRWTSVSSVTYYGDGSNLTGISSPWTRTGTNVTLTNSGDNVGIGTATPGQKLDVTGTIRASSDIKVGANSVCQSTGTNCPSGASVWNVISGSGVSSVIGHTGNVGIGGGATADPGVPFSVLGNDGTGNGYWIGFLNTNSGTNGILKFTVHCKNSNSCGGTLWGTGDAFTQIGKGLSFQNDAAGGQFTFISDPVGIGTVSAGSQLSVLGNASFGSYATTAAPTGGIIVSGNVGIGTAAPGSLIGIGGNAATNQGKAACIGTGTNGVTCLGYATGGTYPAATCTCF